VTLRFLQATASASPDHPFRAGQIITVPSLNNDMKAWLRDGHAEIVRDDEPEMAVVGVSERAVTRKAHK